MALTIDWAKPEDEAAFRALWQGFLAYYDVDLPETTTAHTWARILDPEHRMSCRLAYLDGKAIGFAIHHHHCSSWVPGDDVYLEDLFVAPSARGQGAGRALIEDLISLGREKGWHRLYWNTNHDNAAARKLYDSFCSDDGHVRYRMPLR
ncbi:GNAT family N-acetyltransferase [Thioclava sp. FR2]|uniref:GNAT family N-acetyltransferase n=1 Tax=Thioclava sp. FR2 TaxID=3445780 RepID=UPI003EBC45E5